MEGVALAIPVAAVAAAGLRPASVRAEEQGGEVAAAAVDVVATSAIAPRLQETESVALLLPPHHARAAVQARTHARAHVRARCQPPAPRATLSCNVDQTSARDGPRLPPEPFVERWLRPVL